MDLWAHKKRSYLKWWHTREITGGTSQGEACATSFEMVSTYPTETPVRSKVISQTTNEKRGRGRPNLTWEESVKKDLKDWSIIKEIALDRREWKLAINVPKPCYSVSPLLLLFYVSLFSFFIHPFRIFCISIFIVFSAFFCLVPRALWNREPRAPGAPFFLRFPPFSPLFVSIFVSGGFHL
jgi:hypothetical protein